MKRIVTGLLLFLAISSFAWCAEPAITGTVTDSLGAVIPGATVALVQGGKDVSTTTTDAAGKSYKASFPPVCRECITGPSGSAVPFVVATTGCSPACSECAIKRVSAGCH